MSEATAAQQTPVGLDQDRLTLLFTIYNARLVRTLRARLGANWHLAEDLAQDTWIRAAGSLSSCLVTDDRAWPWISTLAYLAKADHFRLERNRRETATDFGGPLSATLPPADPAEDIAIERITALARVTDLTAPLGEAA